MIEGVVATEILEEPVAEARHALHLLPVARWDAWQAAPADERYAPDAFAAEGFIHCTEGSDEMVAVANRFYAAEPGPFVVLSIDLGALDVPWRFDDPEGQYPHVYGTLPRAAIRDVAPIERAADGSFVAVGPATSVPRTGAAPAPIGSLSREPRIGD